MKSRKDKDVSPITGPQASPRLKTLAPQFNGARHNVYLSALEAAAFDKDNLNIALSGSYGVGKSSVLQKFSQNHEPEVVEVSFSGIRADIQTKFAGGGDVNPASTTKTNQIQKEIVKQLLYRERPASTPASKYRRPETFQWKRELGLSALVGFSLTMLAYITGLLDRPLTAFLPGRFAIAFLLLSITSVVVAVLFGLRRLLHNRVIIEKLSAGPATIALSPQSTTFFDEYLDEIVYFFQASRRRFVVFEDLDRFDDYEIFQSLRALNTLLNRSAQLSAKPVVFVYAVRDSLFESPTKSDEDAAEAEVELANRTKFFDLVIPMVPFVSSRNARDLMMEEIKNREFDISADLVDLAAQHVADMRLILNVMNEYALFDRILVPGETRAPSLTSDKLFALILYKSIHLRDFELIRVGRSTLDTVYERYRDFVSAVTSRAVERASQLQASRVMAGQMSQRAARYGEAVQRYLEVTAAGLDQPSSYPNMLSISGRSITVTELAEPATWREITTDEVGLDVVLAYGYTNQALTLSVAALSRVTGSKLDPSEWIEVDDPALAAEHSSSLEVARTTAHMTMAELCKRPDVLRLEDFVEDYVETFDESLTRILKSKLARSLVREGYIDEYFALYAAQYHASRVSENAMNFIIRRVDRGLSDPVYQLTEDDVEAVLRERPEVVHDKAVLNVDLVDYMIAHNLDMSETVRQLTGQEDDAVSFLQYFFEVAKSKTKLISELAKTWDGLLIYLTSTLETDDANRMELFSYATQSLDDNVRYGVNHALATYVQTWARELPFLTEDSSARSSPAIRLILDLGVKIPDVNVLSRDLRAKVVANDAFEFNETNLEKIIGGKDLSLDNLAAFGAGLFDYATYSMSSYLKIQKASRSTPYTIRQPAVLVQTLTAVSTTALVRDVVNRALPSIRIVSIKDLPIETWETVAGAQMVRPTARNVQEYFGELGWDEAILSSIRRRRTLDEIDELTRAEKDALAVNILSAAGLSGTLRAQIAKRLTDGAVLAPSAVPLTSGELFGLLLQKGLLPDTADTFNASKGTTWTGREALIAASREFPNYVIPSMLTTLEVGAIAGSTSISTDNKSFIFDDLATYTKNVRPSGLVHIANHAQKHKLFIETSDLVVLAQRGLKHDWVIALSWIGLARRSLTEIESTLVALGGKYRDLVTQSSKRPGFVKDFWNQKLLDYLVENGKVKKYDQAWWDENWVVANMKP